MIIVCIKIEWKIKENIIFLWIFIIVVIIIIIIIIEIKKSIKNIKWIKLETEIFIFMLKKKLLYRI